MLAPAAPRAAAAHSKPPAGRRAEQQQRAAAALAAAAAAKSPSSSPSSSAATSTADTAAASPSAPRSSGNFGAAVGLWRGFTRQLFDLEARLTVAASATEKQATTVKTLRGKVRRRGAAWEAGVGACRPGRRARRGTCLPCPGACLAAGCTAAVWPAHAGAPPPFPSLPQVAAGQADPSQLAAEEQRLGALQQQLGRLQADFNSTAKQARGVLAFLGFGGAKEEQEQQQQQPASSNGSRARSGAAASSSGSGSSEPAVRKSGGSGSSLWRAVANQLLDLEAKMSSQKSATERQAAELRALREQVGGRRGRAGGGAGAGAGAPAARCAGRP